MRLHVLSSAMNVQRALGFAALLGLIAFAGILRLRPLSATLPHRIVHDEVYHLIALDLMRGDPEVARQAPLFATYPHLAPRLAWLAAPEPPSAAPGPLDQQLAAASKDLMLLRGICASLSLLIVPGTYLLARRFLDRRVSLLATALIATSLLSIWYASQARPHGPGSALALLAVVAALEVRRRPTVGAYLSAGCAVGAAMGALQTGLAVLPALLVAHVLRDRSRPGSATIRLAAACLPIALFVWAFCPSWYRAENRFLAPVGLESSLFDGQGAKKLLLGLWHFEPLLLALGSALAVALSARWLRRNRSRPAHIEGSPGRTMRDRLRGREDLAIVLAHALPYALAIVLYERANQRYLLPLLPYAVCLVAWFVTRASDRLARPIASRAKRVAVAALPGVALVAVQSALALWMNAVSLSPDTATRAARWIEDHVDPTRERIVIPPNLDLPLLREPNTLRGDLYAERKPTPWATHQTALGERDRGATVWRLRSMPMRESDRMRLESDPIEYARHLDADYAVVELSEKTFFSRLVDGVRANGELVARFSPMQIDRGDDTPFLWWDQQNEYSEGSSWLWRLLHAQSLGGVIEIYRFTASVPE